MEGYTIQLSPSHEHLVSHLQRLLVSRCDGGEGGDKVVDDVELCDFGVKFKVQLRPLEDDGNVLSPVLLISVPEWQDIYEPASRLLKEKYGEPLSLLDAQETGYNISLSIRQAISIFATPEIGLINLSQLRIQTIGAPIAAALYRVASSKTIIRHDNYTSSTRTRYGSCYCVSASDKAMVIFVVATKEETEKAIARIFLQQFELVQKNAPQSPHCEFRRSTQPSAEIGYLIGKGGEWLEEGKSSVGCLSFTFFPSHVKTDEVRLKATQLMVNFFPYLDKHIKSTKSYIHGRMRSQRSNVMRELRDWQATKSRIVPRKGLGPQRNRTKLKPSQGFSWESSTATII